MSNYPNKVSGPHTYVLRTDDLVQVKLHNTIVATLKQTATGGTVTLTSGGYRTATTKMRMNQFANEFCFGHFKVLVHNKEWFVAIHGMGKVPYEDGMTFSI